MAWMTDRLHELQGLTRRETAPDLYSEEGGLEQIGLEEFFSMVDSLNCTIDEVGQKVNEISQVQYDIINKPATHNTSSKERHSVLKEEVNQLSQKVQKGLKRLSDDINQAEKGFDKHTAQFRIKKSQAAALNQKWKQQMIAYNQSVEEHRERCKEVIKRQLIQADPSQIPDDDKVDEILESHNLSEFLIHMSHKQQVLDEVEDRRKEILQLEESMKELHNMFYDMLLLVESQGDLIDNIQHNVDTAAGYVAIGVEQTTLARTYARLNREESGCCTIL